MSFELERFNIQSVPFFKSQREEGSNYYLAHHKENKQERYILKIYTVRNSIDQEKVINETLMNQNAQAASKNVIKVKGVQKSQSVDPVTQIKDKKIIILMQYVNQNLRDVIEFKSMSNENQYITPQEFKIITKNLIETLADLQRNNISHRRIELESIYYVDQNSPFLLGNFYHAKNLIGQQNSEIREINDKELREMRFPDKESLKCLANGEHELKSNYYKMDVYTLGIVLCQLATLKIFEDLKSFDLSIKDVLYQIGERYGKKIQKFISLMLVPRDERQDFLGLQEIIDQYMESEINSEMNNHPSIYPKDIHNLTNISEDIPRDDFTSSSSDNNQFERESIQVGDYSLLQDPKMPLRFLQSSNNRPSQSSAANLASQDTNLFNGRNMQMGASYQAFQQRQKQEVDRNLEQQREEEEEQNQNHHHNSQNYSNYQTEQARQGNIARQGKIARQQQQDYNLNRIYSMNPSQSERVFDRHLQVPMQDSIPFQLSNSKQQQQNTNYNNTKHLQTVETIQRQGKNDDYIENYVLRSTQLRSQNLEQMKYEDLRKKCKNLIYLEWLEKRTIRKGRFVGKGRLSDVFECETHKRNCCVVKIYQKKSNIEVWDMVQSLNKFNTVKCQFVIKVLGYYINPVSEYESELWLIQKQKKYNLNTLHYRFGVLPLYQRLAIAQRLTQTILELHNSNPSIAHGEIKPQNILMDLQLNPFLTDFIICESMTSESQLHKSRGYETGYSAPEQYNDMQFCKNSDTWSLGVIFWEMFIGSRVDAATVKRFGLYDPQRQGCLDLQLEQVNNNEQIIITLIRKMTQYNPDHRIPLKNVLDELINLSNALNRYSNVNRCRISSPQMPVYQQSPQQVQVNKPQNIQVNRPQNVQVNKPSRFQVNRLSNPQINRPQNPSINLGLQYVQIHPPYAYGQIHPILNTPKQNYRH